MQIIDTGDLCKVPSAGAPLSSFSLLTVCLCINRNKELTYQSYGIFIVRAQHHWANSSFLINCVNVPNCTFIELCVFVRDSDL